MDEDRGALVGIRPAFSTLGVPGMPVDEVVRLAAQYGYQGVELRAHPEEPVHPLLGIRERAAVRGRFADAGVQVLAVAGYAKVAAECPGAAAEAALAHELTELVLLAADLGARYVRVFPGGGDRPAEHAAADAVRRLAAVAPLAAERGVRVLLETHDSHRTGAAAARILDAVDDPHVGALWDVLHSWLGGEAPTATRAALGRHLGYVQVKDVASPHDLTPLQLGAGALPLAEVVTTVVTTLDPGRIDWWCWEYEKRWYPNAAELPALLKQGRAHLDRLTEEASNQG
ncbi:sugar phosphate isomerase/epimerase [Streptomyces sp. BHT-5-2]|uniref:sugar phosphate isomerase/epimerase family protein n=1 Tax=Streptomyces sp. BHT-5-2 TaxID=2866715 RepID=UPI001C8F1B82|nr:sugar phosphate isomerase/epimerase family protein [Streptomyces sp. BHT-5-2]QZL02083.1 sugar phosphate isomerase/epimerase [Streptomyces sp. BHT-5-2]